MPSDPLVLEKHPTGYAVVYRRKRTVMIWTLPRKRNAEILMANIDAAMRYEREVLNARTK